MHVLTDAQFSCAGIGPGHAKACEEKHRGLAWSCGGAFEQSGEFPGLVFDAESRFSRKA